ncbi:unnamed protein product [Nesidiocoris tenuis]|uniref:Uncharacterized protein n=1 Tax=Nesidiocoris tenuis TaxID=355587 RepID=A0A6H5FW77_9HEMI|nr:unnamed protein product [Nesidiocoris tenuis]
MADTTCPWALDSNATSQLGNFHHGDFRLARLCAIGEDSIDLLSQPPPWPPELCQPPCSSCLALRSFFRVIIRDRTRAILAMIRALPANRKRTPSAIGMRAIAFMAPIIIMVPIIFFILPRPANNSAK